MLFSFQTNVEKNETMVSIHCDKTTWIQLYIILLLDTQQKMSLYIISNRLYRYRLVGELRRRL